jgi:hypothetical protein
LIDPGFGGFAFAVLFEFIQKLAEAAGEQAACAGAAQHSAEIAEHPAQRITSTWLGLVTSRIAEHIRDLVPVLISGNGKQSQKGSHRWKSAAHVALL